MLTYKLNKNMVKHSHLSISWHGLQSRALPGCGPGIVGVRLAGARLPYSLVGR